MVGGCWNWGPAKENFLCLGPGVFDLQCVCMWFRFGV